MSLAIITTPGKAKTKGDFHYPLKLNTKQYKDLVEEFGFKDDPSYTEFGVRILNAARCLNLLPSEQIKKLFDQLKANGQKVSEVQEKK